MSAPAQTPEASPPRQEPVDGGLPRTFGELWAIVTHPAVRLGFVDAQAGRRLDHDDIVRRIEATEGPRLFGDWDVPLAQYRYEEGRLLVVQVGLRCRAWSNPRYPPAAVRRFVVEHAERLVKAGEGHPR